MPDASFGLIISVGIFFGAVDEDSRFRNYVKKFFVDAILLVSFGDVSDEDSRYVLDHYLLIEKDRRDKEDESKEVLNLTLNSVSALLTMGFITGVVSISLSVQFGREMRKEDEYGALVGLDVKYAKVMVQPIHDSFDISTFIIMPTVNILLRDFLLLLVCVCVMIFSVFSLVSAFCIIQEKEKEIRQKNWHGSDLVSLCFLLFGIEVCGQADVWGDGVVPEVSVHLEGALNISLDRVYHSPVGSDDESCPCFLLVSLCITALKSARTNAFEVFQVKASKIYLEKT
ncbi:hypothetical protein POM88_024130 [Heracleum sosnowskyi]|uniref:Uncharacterized protein n=1 Tax=Heracleum sosnowskyi TaxID=360622 RepID=A0AAD8IM03_9APIA|nr:hypothetical protein POM88_024130 [Heracleum sosnowskyi]